MFRHFGIIMDIYFIENYKDMFPGKRGRELTDRLIGFILSENGIAFDRICRTDKGKPFVAGYEDVFISVSHSRDVFACALNDKETGIDIQHERKINVMKTACRYFAKDEQEYVKEHGKDGFFRLWTRKEAYSKYTGRGLEDVMSGASVLEMEDMIFTDFQMEQGLYCSCCTRRDG